MKRNEFKDMLADKLSSMWGKRGEGYDESLLDDYADIASDTDTDYKKEAFDLMHEDLRNQPDYADFLSMLAEAVLNSSIDSEETKLETDNTENTSDIYQFDDDGDGVDTTIKTEDIDTDKDGKSDAAVVQVETKEKPEEIKHAKLKKDENPREDSKPFKDDVLSDKNKKTKEKTLTSDKKSKGSDFWKGICGTIGSRKY